MGSLKPGATYVYERDGKVVYAREMGAPPDTRQVVGWDYDPENPDFKNWSKKFIDDYLWDDIMKASETNVALQEALERVKVIYYLSKDKPIPPDWHPV
jgi:hypothetical protein